MSFFIRDKNKVKSKSSKKRKTTQAVKPPAKKRKELDEDITSESESEHEEKDDHVDVASSSEDENETAAEKRNRLAKLMLEQIKEKLSNEDEEVTSYLKNEILERAGRLQHNVADQYVQPVLSDMKFCTWSKLKVVTCAVLSSDNKWLFSGSKDGTIVKWSLPSCSKLQVIKRLNKKEIISSSSSAQLTTQSSNNIGHFADVLALALTKDAKYLASGGADKVIQIWDPATLNHLHTFQGHKSAILGLCFQHGTHQLFSASKDKSIKIWNLDEMAYVETLFGHEDEVTSIDCLAQERAVSSGARDRSVRFWKVPEESHLVFHGHSGCIDCVKLIDDHHFVSAADDNSLSLWTTERKKPIFTVKNAHNNIDDNSNIYLIDSTLTNDSNADKTDAEDVECKKNNSNNNNNNICDMTSVKNMHKIILNSNNHTEQWISSIAALKYSDLVASGSRDGQVRFWKVLPGFKSLERLFTLQLDGFINSLQFSDDGQYLVAGIGQEHRMGRWFRPLKNVKNSLCVIQLRKQNGLKHSGSP